MLTVHPIFLPLNLTEVYALTAYLPQLMDRGRRNDEIIEDIINRIKFQLSDYAFEKLFPGERRRLASNDYLNDEMLANQRKGTLMYLMKSGERCKFFWRGEEYYGRIVYKDRKYKIELDDGTLLDADVDKLGEVEFVILEYK